MRSRAWLTTRESDVLVAVHEFPGMTGAELVDATGVERRALLAVLENLETHGFVAATAVLPARPARQRAVRAWTVTGKGAARVAARYAQAERVAAGALGARTVDPSIYGAGSVAYHPCGDRKLRSI